MSKRERESSDINSHRPLKRQRKIEADINCLPVEIAEKILLFIPKQNLQGNFKILIHYWRTLLLHGQLLE